MKLLRLKITDPKGFRSLQPGFEVFFRNERNRNAIDDFNPFVLAGPNGSGKSNLLEVLAAIFFHLECMYLDYRPDSFEYNEETNPQGFQGAVSTPDGFELEYLIQNIEKDYFTPAVAGLAVAGRTMAGATDYGDRIKVFKICINKKIGKSPEFRRVESETGEEIELSGKQEIKKILPDYILGYSSGENEIVSLPFYKMRFVHFDEYDDTLSKQMSYQGEPEGRLVYLDEHFNQILLLSNFLIQKKDDLSILQQEIQLEDIKQFSLIIRLDAEVERYISKDQELTHDERKKIKENRDKLVRNLRSDITDTNTTKKLLIIDKLEACATSSFISCDADGNELYLQMDYFVNEETKNAFRFHFSDNFGKADPLKLFQALQILYTLNYSRISANNREKIYSTQNIYLKQDLTNISLDENSIFRIKDLKLQKGNLSEDIFTRSLSDGEYQLLHSIGLCLLYRNTNSLFLLDEPETHFNPDWRAKFITLLKKAFEGSDGTQDLLITTHTPYLISDSKRENVLVFEKKDEICTVMRPDYNTFGASINKITMVTFGKKVTIGAYAESLISEIRSRFKQGDDPVELIEELDRNLGDSVEKIILLKTIHQNIESGVE